MTRRLSAWLGLSLAIHAGLATVTLHALNGTDLPVLFIDLRELTNPGGGTPTAGSGHGAAVAPVAGPSPRGGTLARRGPPPPASRSAVPVADAPLESPPAMAPPAPPLEPAPTRTPEPPRVRLDAAPVPDPAAATAPMETIPPVVGVGPPRLGGAGRGESVSPSAGSVSGGAGAPAGSAAGAGSAATGGSGAAGSGDGAALARGVPGDGAGDGVPDIMYDELLRRLRRALVYPSQARQRRIMGVVEVVLEIQPSGTITQVAVIASSSHQILDDAAVETLRGLGRLPFPPGVRPRKLSVRVPVVYELR